jgi:adenine-specific DNA-methyltransferase
MFTDQSNELFTAGVERDFSLKNGQLLFTGLEQYPVKFSDLFFVKVGAVSGNNKIFRHDEYGIPFVTSQTYKSGKTENYIYTKGHPSAEVFNYLKQFKNELLSRGIQEFDGSNWWKWGRGYYQSDLRRIYVNCLLRTNNDRPFFINECKCYDGSVLAVFPLDQNLNIVDLRDALNNVNWKALGFMDGKRYKFSQKSLENAMLPPEFKEFLTQVENIGIKHVEDLVIDRKIYTRAGLYPKKILKTTTKIDKPKKKIIQSFG